MTAFKYEGRDLEAMAFARRYHEWIAALFRPYLGRRIAEVGAGSGNFTELILRGDVEELSAIEPSSEMFSSLRERTMGDTRVRPVNAFFADVAREFDGQLDSVVYVNVLEHVEHDEAELQHMFNALRPGGHACIFVPALPWLYSKHDASIGHYRRYTKRALRQRMEAAGFEIVRARYFDVIGILPWLLLMRCLGRSPGAGSVSLYDSAVVPVSRALESIVPPPVGKNLIFVGRKPVTPVS